MDGGAEEKPSDTASGDADEKWVCEVCGYVYEGALPEDYVCPVCGVGADQFRRLG
jgi:rubredoxin